MIILGESNLTFTGQPKSMVFLEHEALFERFADKIRHVDVGTGSALVGNPNSPGRCGGKDHNAQTTW